jgi:hypothetical protein
MWVPDGLYERLPLLYGAGAAMCPWLLGTSVAAWSSAAMLTGAAVLTVVRRREARRPAPPPVRRSRAPSRLLR